VVWGWGSAGCWAQLVRPGFPGAEHARPERRQRRPHLAHPLPLGRRGRRKRHESGEGRASRPADAGALPEQRPEHGQRHLHHVHVRALGAGRELHEAGPGRARQRPAAGASLRERLGGAEHRAGRGARELHPAPLLAEHRRLRRPGPGRRGPGALPRVRAPPARDGLVLRGGAQEGLRRAHAPAHEDEPARPLHESRGQAAPVGEPPR